MTHTMCVELIEFIVLIELIELIELVELIMLSWTHLTNTIKFTLIVELIYQNTIKSLKLITKCKFNIDFCQIVNKYILFVVVELSKDGLYI